MSQLQALDWANGQVVAAGVTSTASNVFDANFDRVVEICGSAACWYTVGTAPVATNGTKGSQYLPMGVFNRILVPAGQKIAVITSGTSGNVGLIPEFP